MGIVKSVLQAGRSGVLLPAGANGALILPTGWAASSASLSRGFGSESAPRGLCGGVNPSHHPPEATFAVVRQQTHYSLVGNFPHLRSHRPPKWSSTTGHTSQPRLLLTVICPGPSNQLIFNFVPRNRAEASWVIAALAARHFAWGGCRVSSEWPGRASLLLFLPHLPLSLPASYLFRLLPSAEARQAPRFPPFFGVTQV